MLPRPGAAAAQPDHQRGSLHDGLHHAAVRPGLGHRGEADRALALGRIEAGGWAIALSGVCDVLDGRLARAQKVASAYGKFIDSTLDRFVETFAFLGFAVYFTDRPWGPLVVAAGLGGSLLVSYAQARGETVGVSGSGGLMQRSERIVLSALGCLFDPLLSRAAGLQEGSVLLWVLGLIAAGAFATAIHRTVWIARRLRG